MEAEGRGGSDGGEERGGGIGYCNANNLNKDDYRGP